MGLGACAPESRSKDLKDTKDIKDKGAPGLASSFVSLRSLVSLVSLHSAAGVLAVLLGETWLFRSTALLQYAVFMFILFHLVVVVYEERTLESRFGESYRAYRRAVPRWGFTVHPFTQGSGSSA